MFEDEFAGQGGTYLFDPKTGKRTRVEDAPTDVPPAVELAVKKSNELPVKPNAVNDTAQITKGT